MLERPRKSCTRRLTVSLVFVFHVKFAETKVTESNVPGVIEQYIFRLQITVNDVKTMQTF